ncbi:MAG: hypothetical protein IJC59_01340 [Lachnospiraceae bacterium]|nr:hypothetical protein [Lachnospiraceae bacterium]
MMLAIFGPRLLTGYRDRNVLGRIREQEVDSAGAGYRYQLSSNEKLFILSECLNSQKRPEAEGSKPGREEETTESSYQEGTYAFVVNYEEETSRESFYASLNDGIALLKEEGILPSQIQEIVPQQYEAALYSAIDVLEPRNNVAVWKLNLISSRQNMNQENRLLDAYIDADSGKLYEFYIRTDMEWADIDAQALVRSWAEYMGLYGMEEYETKNPLLETTPYYQKYVFPGIGDERTIVTVGFYEGIDELFLKITK